MSEIDGAQATSIVQRYFLERYGEYGVIMFEVENAEFSHDRWVVKCSFFRSLLSPAKSVYTVVVRPDGKIDSVTKEEKMIQ